MLVLGIDTSTRVGGLGLYDSERGLIGESNLTLEQTHSERLMPVLEHLLKACGVKVQAIDGIAVTVGPGSFTGVRIGVTTAKTLAQVIARPLTGISTLEAVAYNLPLVQGLVSPAFDARNRRVYKALFRGTGRGLERLTEDDSGTIDELVAELLQRDETVYFLGDALALYRELLGEQLGSRAVFPPFSLTLPRGGVIAELGEKAFRTGRQDDLYGLVPNYLKPAEAEVNWQKKYGSR